MPSYTRHRVTQGVAGRRPPKSWADGPRPKYFGPLMLGKAADRPPEPNGPDWIGKRIPTLPWRPAFNPL